MRKFSPILLIAFLGCIPGGIIDKGGYVDNAGFVSSATLTHGYPYNIVCIDNDEVLRREKLKAEAENSAEQEKSATPAGRASGEEQGPPVKYVDPGDYTGGCEQEGESSVFILFNFIPVTSPLNPEYAIGIPVQKMEGDSMINIRYWHETHYYSALGRVSVFKIRGDVIKYLSEDEIKQREARRKKAEQDRARQKQNPGGRR